MTEYRITYGGILSSIWKGGNHGTIVLASGLPQYLDKYHPFLSAIEKLELTLFAPRYLGTWESSGHFSFENSVKTIRDTINIVLEGEALELFAQKEIAWSTENIYLLGFSFGALPTLFVDHKKIKKILLCPIISPKFHTNGKGEPLDVTFSYLERAYPHVYRLDADKLMTELSELELPIEQENFIIGAGREDTVIPEEEIASIRGMYNTRMHWLDIGHSLELTAEQLMLLLD